MILLPAASASAADASATLEERLVFAERPRRLCQGTTLKNKDCTRAISARDVSAARRLLEDCAAATGVERKLEILFQLAEHVLCRRDHQYQKAEIHARWLREVRDGNGLGSGSQGDGTGASSRGDGGTVVEAEHWQKRGVERESVDRAVIKQESTDKAIIERESGYRTIERESVDRTLERESTDKAIIKREGIDKAVVKRESDDRNIIKEERDRDIIKEERNRDIKREKTDKAIIKQESVDKNTQQEHANSPAGIQKPSLSFQTASPHRSTAAVNALVQKALAEPLSPTALASSRKDTEGCVYAYMFPSVRPLKIGHTNNLGRRLRDIGKACQQEPRLLCSFYTRLHVRVERIVHAHLANERLRSDPCGGCGLQHQEWFDVRLKVAAAVMSLWTRWSEREPYDGEGRLKEEWVARLKTVDLGSETCWEAFVHDG